MNVPAPDPQSAAALARAAAVRLMAFDVDGTLTDGGIHISAQGEAFKRFSVRDGLGLVLLRDNGVRVAIVTGRSSAIVEQRARELAEYLLHAQGRMDAALGRFDGRRA